MNKRLFVLILIIVCAIAGVAVLIWTFLPLFQNKTTRSQQPPSLERQIQPKVNEGKSSIGVQVTSTSMSDEQKKVLREEQISVERIKRLSIDFAARVGSYSNADAFGSLRASSRNSTDEVQAFLENERQKLEKVHPIKNGSWGQTTQALSALIKSPIPIKDQTKLEVVVQSRVTQENKIGNSNQYQETLLEWTKLGGGWLVSHVSWREFQP